MAELEERETFSVPNAFIPEESVGKSFEQNHKLGNSNSADSLKWEKSIDIAPTSALPPTPRVRPATAEVVDEKEKTEEQFKRFRCLGCKIFTPLISFGMAMAVIFVVSLYSFMYLSCLWDPQSKLSNVPVAIVNFDSGFGNISTSARYASYQPRIASLFPDNSVGAIIQDVFFNESSPIANALQFVQLEVDQSVAKSTESELDAIVKKLDDGELWGLLVIPKETSLALLSNIEANDTHLPNPNATTLKIQLYYSQARQMTVSGLVVKTMQAIVQGIQMKMSGAFIKEAYAHPNGSQSSFMSLSFIQLPITLELMNRAPIPVFGLNFASYIGCIVLWIGSIMISTLLFRVYSAHASVVFDFAKDPFFKTRYVFLGIMASLFLSFISALVYFIVLILLAGDASFLNPNYQLSTFLLYLWLLSATFLFMNCLLAFALGQNTFSIFASLILILQLATSSAILDPVVMPNITSAISQIFPMSYGIDGLKCIILGSRCNNLMSSVQVNVAWMLSSCFLCSVILFLQTFKKIKSM